MASIRVAGQPRPLQRTDRCRSPHQRCAQEDPLSRLPRTPRLPRPGAGTPAARGAVLAQGSADESADGRSHSHPPPCDPQTSGPCTQSLRVMRSGAHRPTPSPNPEIFCFLGAHPHDRVVVGNTPRTAEKRQYPTRRTAWVGPRGLGGSVLSSVGANPPIDGNATDPRRPGSILCSSSTGRPMRPRRPLASTSLIETERSGRPDALMCR